MGKIFYLLIVILLSTSTIKAQTTEGKEFWLTFGHIRYHPTPDYVNLQIRIVAKDYKTTGNIFFTNLGTSNDFEIEARQVYTYVLSDIEKAAVYNAYQTLPTGNDFSVHITSNMPVTVYAMNQMATPVDATNILPVTALGNEYYQISRTGTFIPNVDAYAVIATEENTEVYQNNIQVATLNRGYVFYTCNVPDMTGYYISANKPIAHFALSSAAALYTSGTNTLSCLFQQMVPIHIWGKEFFVPVSHDIRDLVRIVASQKDTYITQTGGIVRTDVPGAQTTLDNLLQPGQFVELEVPLSNVGCYIKADKPVGVCTFLPGIQYGEGNPAQSWLPPIEQSVTNALIAPFIPIGNTWINAHYATLFTQISTTQNIKVSIGGAEPTDLIGGVWYDNDTVGMSFYKMPLTNDTAAYYFTSSSGRFLILGYGASNGMGSYYYLAYSAMRNLSAAFTANNIPYGELSNHIFCEQEITFVANVDGIHPDEGSLEWYIDGEIQSEFTDSLTWSKNFATGNYLITMSVMFENDSTKTYEDTLKIANCGAVFYVNNVHYENLQDTVFCTKDVYFQAEIENYTEVKWFINGTEYVPDNPLEWSNSFESGTYNIEMWVRFENGEETVPPISSTLKIEMLWIKIRNVRY